jgi:hypothetical protein
VPVQVVLFFCRHPPTRHVSATQTNTALSSGRRKRAIPEGTATPEAIASFTLKGSFPLHKTTQPGILALALHPTEVRRTECAYRRVESTSWWNLDVACDVRAHVQHQTARSFGSIPCRTPRFAGSCNHLFYSTDHLSTWSTDDLCLSCLCMMG